MIWLTYSRLSHVYASTTTCARASDATATAARTITCTFRRALSAVDACCAAMTAVLASGTGGINETWGHEIFRQCYSFDQIIFTPQKLTMPYILTNILITSPPSAIHASFISIRNLQSCSSPCMSLHSLNGHEVQCCILHLREVIYG